MPEFDLVTATAGVDSGKKGVTDEKYFHAIPVDSRGHGPDGM